MPSMTAWTRWQSTASAAASTSIAGCSPKRSAPRSPTPRNAGSWTRPIGSASAPGADGLRERPDFDADPVVREAVGVRPARGIGRDDGHRDAERLNFLRQAVAVPVRVVLRRCAQQNLIARALMHEGAD